MRVKVASGSSDRVRGQFAVEVSGETSIEVLRSAYSEALAVSGVAPSSSSVNVAGPNVWHVSADLKDHDDEAQKLFVAFVASLRGQGDSGVIKLKVGGKGDISIFDILVESGKQGCWDTVLMPKRPGPKSATGFTMVSPALARSVASWLADFNQNIWVAPDLAKSFTSINNADFVDWFTDQVRISPGTVLSAVTRIDSSPVAVNYVLGGYIEVQQMCREPERSGLLADLRSLYRTVDPEVFSGLSERKSSFVESLQQPFNQNDVNWVDYCLDETDTIFDVGLLTIFPAVLVPRVVEMLESMISRELVNLDGRILGIEFEDDSICEDTNVAQVRALLTAIVAVPRSVR